MTDPNFQGIDPQLLSQLTSSISKGASTGQQLAGSYLGRFTQLGLDTGAVNKLLSDFSWAQRQQGMLQRRYDLASHQPSGQWVNGMATSGAGTLKYATKQQAQTAGADAGKQFRDGKISASQFLTMLQQNEHDPDWQTGAMRTLGQQGLWDIKEDGAILPTAQGQAQLKALALAVAAAMANGVTFPDPDDEEPGSEDISLLAPLLKYADFPPQVLATLGKEAMAPGNYMYSQEVWQALAANPDASALFIKQNASFIVSWVNAGDHGGGLPDDQANEFAAVLKAGTIGIKGTNPQLGGQAVSGLVTAVANNQSGHATGVVDAAYGKIIQAYWPDVMFSVTSTATDPHGYLKSPDGMHLSPTQWAAFTREAMRDPKTAASLLATAHAQDQEWLKTANGMPGNSGDSYALQGGLVAGFFDSQATYVYQKEVSNAGAWKNSVTGAIGTVVGDTVSIVTDPGKWAGTIATSAATYVATNVLTSFVNGLPNGGGPTLPSLSTWQSTHETDAVDAFDSASANPQLQAQDPLDRALVESARNYDHGSFVVPGKNGAPATIMNPKNMSRRQLQAYNAWLNDPAVVAKTMNVGPDVAWGQGYWDYTGQENTTPQR